MSLDGKRESALQGKLITAIKARGGKAIKLAADGTVGEPDVLCSGWTSDVAESEQATLVECKAAGEEPTEMQAFRAHEWLQAGVRVAWIDDEGSLARFLATGTGKLWPS